MPYRGTKGVPDCARKTGAGQGIRTPTASRPSGPKPDASASSASPASRDDYISSGFHEARPRRSTKAPSRGEAGICGSITARFQECNVINGQDEIPQETRWRTTLAKLGAVAKVSDEDLGITSARGTATRAVASVVRMFRLPSPTILTPATPVETAARIHRPGKNVQRHFGMWEVLQVRRKRFSFFPSTKPGSERFPASSNTVLFTVRHYVDHSSSGREAGI